MTACSAHSRRPELRPALAVLVAIAAALASPGVARGDDPARPKHLDVFVLVDVSTSMYVADHQRIDYGAGRPLRGGPLGSDPQRQRWDAVRLLLDLLTVDDQVTILPFNDLAPASYSFGANPLPVPGDVTGALQSPRAGGGRLGGKVESFAHNGPGPQNDPNKDIGQGTGIFVALQEAHKRAASAPRASDRTAVILLLTDGDDTELIKINRGAARSLVDRYDRALTEAIRGPEARDLSIPVYTMGLGNDIREDLLQRIARLTGGSYRKISSARVLVETFRDLVWSLKYCWIMKPKTGVRQSREELKGILDLGVLSFHPGASVFTREARRASPSPAIAAAESLRFHGDQRRGNNGKDYLYEYFGPATLNQADPLTRIAGDIKADAIAVDWTADPAGDPREIRFSKRTIRPLFTLSEPVEGDGFDRLESLPVAATFQQDDPFRPEHFRLWYSLRPAGAEPDPGGLLPMEANFRDKRFQAQAVLPQAAPGASPRYTLRVEAEGLEGEGLRPLAGYRLVLPERTIEVRDGLRLVAEPPLAKLTAGTRKATIRVRGYRPLIGEVKLSYRLEMPAKKGPGGGKVAAGAITVEPRPGSLATGDVVLRNGSAEIDLTLASGGNEPDRTAEYDPGSLILSAGKELGLTMPDLRIPVQLQLRPAALKIDATGPIRAVSGNAKPPPPMPLKVVEDGETGLAARAGQVVVTLSRSAGAEFKPEELWIEPIGDSPATNVKSRTLTLPLGRGFTVRFAPLADAKHVGHHQYELVARLAGKDEPQAVAARASVSIEYEYPRLDLDPSSVTARVPKGKSRTVEVRAFLRGQAGERRTLEFRPDSPVAGSISARVVPEGASVLAGDAGTPLSIELTAGPEAEIGPQTLSGAIHAREGGAKEAPIRLIAVVDELKIADITAKLDDVRKPIPVELWWGTSHTRRLMLTTASGGVLPAEIAAAIDPRNDNGAWLLPRQASVALGAARGAAREVTVEFPKVNNVEFNRAYHVYLDLVPGPDTGLPPRLVEFEIRYRRVDDLRPASP